MKLFILNEVKDQIADKEFDEMLYTHDSDGKSVMALLFVDGDNGTVPFDVEFYSVIGEEFSKKITAVTPSGYANIDFRWATNEVLGVE
ncbi:hypothetical protein EQG49_08120 [Periweissella cryptocerci]|uniref:Uncharacterized protein n=1 Tax=Periweissella cryptocerci TaxID=2506420 RepID=A0A4V1AIR6_9LACO|nr:hypothetical protein [Periweissella cryptocerci]QBO36435.1 hypothetical protein EQG49_08120 [Periweissella cryptocerci]